MSESAVNNKRIAKNTIFLYFRTFIIMLISLYTSRAVLDALGETDFGIYNLVGGIVVLFAFMNSAMSAATQRYLNYELGRGDEDAVAKVFSMSINVHIGISALVLLLGETIGLWFVMTQLNIPEDRFTAAMWVYHLSLIGCCINILRIPYNACIIAYERMSFYAYVSIIEAILKLAIVFLLLVITTCDRLFLYSLLMLIVIAVVNVIYLIFCNKQFTTSHYAFFWNRDLFVQLMSFSGWSMFGSIATTTAGQGISILLNIFYGVTLNAAMGLAHQVHAAVTSFISSFQTAFSPQIVKSYAINNKEEFTSLVCRSSRLSYCLVFLFAIPLIFSIDTVLRVWLTIVPEYTSAFVNIFIIYCMIESLSGPLYVSVQATGDIKKYQIIMSLLILSNIPIMLILLYIGVSPIWVVAVRAIINLITHFARIIYLNYAIEFPSLLYLKNVMLRVLIMTIVGLPLAFFLKPYTNSVLGTIIVFLTLIVQNLILVIFIGVESQERRTVFSMLKKRIRK